MTDKRNAGKVKTVYKNRNKNTWGGAYFLSMIGAAVYYIQQSDGFWTVVLALLKALVWPAFVIYHVLKLHG
ncbi:MAG TPA: hypothetical protein VHB72_04115 [Candidatus Saccharimonadales bacterium]|nr:hypothetical protein [Candidatus Saccharimonadales bacterium]